MFCSLEPYFYFIFWFRYGFDFLVKKIKTFKVIPSRLLEKVKALAKISPSEFMIKQSCLSLATSIPTKIMEEHLFKIDFDTVLEPRVLSAIVSLLYINRHAVSN